MKRVRGAPGGPGRDVAQPAPNIHGGGHAADLRLPLHPAAQRRETGTRGWETEAGEPCGWRPLVLQIFHIFSAIFAFFAVNLSFSLDRIEHKENLPALHVFPSSGFSFLLLFQHHYRQRRQGLSDCCRSHCYWQLYSMVFGSNWRKSSRIHHCAGQRKTTYYASQTVGSCEVQPVLQ